MRRLQATGAEVAAALEEVTHKTEELVIAMRVIEHALQGVYILPKQAEGLLSAFSKPDVLEL